MYRQNVITFTLLFFFCMGCKKDRLEPTAAFKIANDSGIISLTNQSSNAKNFLWEITDTKTNISTKDSTENLTLNLLCSTEYLIKLKVWQDDISKANEITKKFNYSCFSIIDTNAIKGKYKLKCNCLEEETYFNMVKVVIDTTRSSFDTIMEYRFPIENREGYMLQEMPKKMFVIEDYDVKKKVFNYGYYYRLKSYSTQIKATFKTAVDSLLINYLQNASLDGSLPRTSISCKYKGVKIK